MSQGYYCLIQYCPDFSRAETANVGVLVFRAEPAASAVRVVDDVRTATKRLGRKTDTATLLGSVRAMASRIEHERFHCVEDLDRFARTRGNQLLLTAPRSMRVDVLERDAEELFTELVADARLVTSAAMPEEEASPLARTFERLRSAKPERVFVDHDFTSRDLGIPVHADFAYRNGQLNLVREMPRATSLQALRDAAMGLSKEAELARRLEEGDGRLFVVARALERGRTAKEREQHFGELLGKLKGPTFIPSAEVVEFAERVERELLPH